jgi:hypothetical protein
MREKFNILQEDDTKIYNKWVKGIAKQEAPSEVITVDDIVNTHRNSTTYKGPENLPFGLNSLLQQIGNLFVQSANLRLNLRNSLSNPVISDYAQKVRAVNTINDKLAKIQEIIFSTTEDMNKIVENPKK